MITQKYPLSPPSLSALAAVLQPALSRNYAHCSVSVSPCPDLRQPPFHLAAQGLSGDEKIAEVGGQSNLFPSPDLSAVWSLPEIARDAMGMDAARGMLLGAGAGPYRDVGQNSEWAPCYSWEDNKVRNESRCALVRKDTGKVEVRKQDSLGCALMCNLFGSRGEPGDVLRITARRRTGDAASFTECVQAALREAYGDAEGSTVVSLGGVVLIKKGLAKYHVMPDFPDEKDRPFRDLDQLMKWLTWHEYRGPIVGLTVLHSADPGGKVGLRLEHTHTFSATGEDAGGHYHYDIEDEGGEDVEYEAYFNTAKSPIHWKSENDTSLPLRNGPLESCRRRAAIPSFADPAFSHAPSIAAASLAYSSSSASSSVFHRASLCSLLPFVASESLSQGSLVSRQNGKFTSFSSLLCTCVSTMGSIASHISIWSAVARFARGDSRISGGEGYFVSRTLAISLLFMIWPPPLGSAMVGTVYVSILGSLKLGRRVPLELVEELKRRALIPVCLERTYQG
ncbi:hypothetical protein Micbo1qcDRAFT_196324 [Microdochium bolleyi]|uniref:DUF1907 domain-containing protein n=1 Tax=Microdochium bolleyi TaxID=196109 RepID=A0A136IYY9_9PEZI|nr:hypothetical protein Micbo1qcDRAFT_196324 [Microdochium bolleyi]